MSAKLHLSLVEVWGCVTLNSSFWDFVRVGYTSGVSIITFVFLDYRWRISGENPVQLVSDDLLR